MATTFPEGALNTWQPSIYKGHKALDVHTQYFTVHRHAPDERNLAFGDGINPEGVFFLDCVVMI